MKLLLILLPLLFFLQTTFGCINESGFLRSAKEEDIWLPTLQRLQSSLKTDLSAKGKEWEVQLRDATGFTQRGDYAVALIYLGRSREAVPLLEKLEKEQPGQYFVAANLGTAYELSGDNEKALQWIKEGIERNPDSHKGTEWLHVKILEAKIAQAKDPQYFEKNSVLNLPAGELDPDESIVAVSKKQTLRDIRMAVEYQLRERLQFVKNRDLPVASLLFDLARIDATNGSLETAREFLKMAGQFGYPDATVQELLKTYERQLFWRKATDFGIKAGVSLLIIGILGFFIVRWVKRPILVG